MKRTILCLCCILYILNGYAQLKKPIIMVKPADVWCATNGYMKTIDNQGVTQLEPDYMSAFQTNNDLNDAISKIGGLMAERGFPLKDMLQELRKLQQRNAATMVASSKSGNEASLSPADELYNTVRPDIAFEINWHTEKEGRTIALKHSKPASIAVLFHFASKVRFRFSVMGIARIAEQRW